MGFRTELIEIEETKKRERQKNFSTKYIDIPVEFFIRHNVSPNVLSLIGFACSLVAAFLIAIGWIYFSIWLAWFVPFLIGLGGAFDLFDGEVARRTDKDSWRISDIYIRLYLIIFCNYDFLHTLKSRE
ncbi:MAG: CDP-alcohol phosphatidyltransferase family protein [Promethearchaeota archaeon]